MKTTHCNIPSPISARAAVLADYHSRYSSEKKAQRRIDKVISLLSEASPDFILCPGDFFNHSDELHLEDHSNANGFELLREVRKIAPVFYSIGNHEHGLTAENRSLLEKYDICVLDNEFTSFGDFRIGGLTTGYRLDAVNYKTAPAPDLDFIAEFAKESAYKILLCHHPEYWVKYIVNSGIDLTVSGHAHGGQWRFFSRGVYAPGQGLFPKYVSGVHRNKDEYLAISRGMTNTVPVPRFFNPCEIVILHIGG